MSKDLVIIIIGWFITILLLLLFVPRNKLREAHVSFLFMQVLTWVLGLIVVEFRFIEYPYRSFPYATRTCFDFEYFIYPSFSILFNLYYPDNKNCLRQFMHYFCYCGALTLVELIVQSYTNIIHYIHWAWYISYASFFITFHISRKYYVWFFRMRK